MIAFIDDHRGAYGVEPICKVLPIAPSTYRAHVARRIHPARLAPRTTRDLVLAAEIRRVFEANFSSTGCAGCGGNLAARSATTAACPLDRVNRQFRAPRPNVLWLSDFTYVATWQGFVYVAFVIDGLGPARRRHLRCFEGVGPAAPLPTFGGSRPS